MKITTIILLLAFAFQKTEAQRMRNSHEEWNSNAMCLEQDFSRLVSVGGWHHSPWLGAYFQTNDWWVFHCNKGWLYPESDGNKGVWFFWEKANAWVWTRFDVYPLAFNAEREKWFDFCVK